MDDPRASALPALLALAGVVLATPLTVHVVLRARDDDRARRLGARLSSDIATFRAQRWTRPVLRGAALDGNAAPAIHRAAAPLGPLGDRPFAGLSDALEQGRAIPPATRALAAPHGARLDAARDATRRAWAWTDGDLERGASVRYPEYRAALRATRLVLVRATEAAPCECLRACADVLRIAQDLAPGTGFLGLMVGVTVQRPAVGVALRCAARASAAERAAAASEVTRLATDTPPLGYALEAEALIAGVIVRDLVRATPRMPGNVDEALQVALRGRLLEVWTALARVTPRWRAYAAGRDADAALAADLDHLDRVSGRHAVTDGLTTSWRRYLDRDAAGRAHVRALAVALAAMAAGALPERGPPALATFALRDPFTQRPLRWRVAPDGGARVWSVGPDRRDHGGAPGSDDVALEVPPPR